MSLWYKKLAIILPTFNESKNLRILLNKIVKVTPNAYIIIVDDSNFLENRKIVKIAQSFKNIEVVTREKKLGRGSAVIHGFAHAWKNKKIEYFVEMDTDLAHDPQELSVLYKSLKNEGAELVIGSRYIDASKIVNWPMRRLIMSKIINFFLNLWLSLKLHDYTNGYRMYTRKAVGHVVKTGLHEKNFIALSESAFLLKRKGYKIIEVPITFTDRKHGQSSVGVKELWMSLVGALRIKLRYNLSFNQKQKWFTLSKIQALLLLVLIALSLRLWHLNDMGKTWDEPAYVEQGYFMIEALRKGEFNNPQVYHSDHPPFARYLYGLAEELQVGSNHKTGDTFPYDYTYPRIVSLAFSLFSVVLVFLIGWEYISPFVGFSAGSILAMLPFFLGFSQIATLEGFIMFFFTASVYSFLKLLQTGVRRWMVFTGVAIGIALLVKQSNALLFSLLFILYYSHFLYKKKIKLNLISVFFPLIKKSFWKGLQDLAGIVVISLVTFVILWPFIIFHIQDVLRVQDTMWIKHVALPPPEVFFGRLMLVPLPYYIVMFLITTPVIILILSAVGLLRIDKSKKWVLFALVIWFLFPFLQSFYTFKQHGIRYIIELYAPISLIAAFGFEALVNAFTTKRWMKLFLVFLLFFYMFFILFKSSPYYLDYFNGVVGGTNEVYKKKLFQLGWWGQGLKEAGIYLENNAKKGSTIGLVVQPPFSFPQLQNFKVEEYKENKKYDYVVVSYFKVLREQFDDEDIRKKYTYIHCVTADKACLVFIYKKK